MEIIRKEFFFKAANGRHDIFGCKWYEKGKTSFKGIIQIAHGMSEHILRYEDLAIYLVKKGYLVCGNDHTGHGQSVENQDDFGYFGDGDENWHFIVEDMHNLMEKIKSQYGEAPYCLIGHSMGSFLARAFCVKYGQQLDGLILIGTSSGHRLIDMAINASDEFAKLKGDKSRGGFINKLMIEAFNVKYFPRHTVYDWLSSDEKNVEGFMNDEKCAFMFTYSGYRDLFKLLKYVNLKNWYEEIPKNLPILLLSGKDDPVGNYGKGPTAVFTHLIEHGHDNVSIKIYEGMRHEILNEKNKCIVYKKIGSWISKNVN